MNETQFFEDFFQPYETRGYRVSLESRKRLGLDEDSNLTFGQITSASLYGILDQLKPKSGERLLDLGSGLGKIVMGGIYFYRDLYATGVEILPELHQLAESILSDFERQLVPKASERLNLVCGDMFETDLSSYDYIFINSTCYDDEMLLRTQEHLKAAKIGARVISLGRVFRLSHFKQVYAGGWRMGWQTVGGKSPVYIYETIEPC